ncbi:hypothetical protein [Verrucomicrobium sp. 3C]|nr:hypothetical protein [Verrucomicrobium sp. 3C]
MAVPLEDTDKNPEGIGGAQAQRDSARLAVRIFGFGVDDWRRS